MSWGSDAYITKPFNPAEVVAYVKAMSRRYFQLGAEVPQPERPSRLVAQDLTLDLQSFVLKKGGQFIPLTSTELKTDFCEFCRQYLSDKYEEIQLAGFQLTPDIPETPLCLPMDHALILRAMDNLFGNVLKHNSSGTTITFRVRAVGSGVFSTPAA